MSEEVTQPQDDRIKLKLRMQDESNELVYRVKTKSHLSKLFKSYCSRNDLQLETVRFVFEGTRIRNNADDTPESLGMADGDVIEVVTRQNGGGYQLLQNCTI